MAASFSKWPQFFPKWQLFFQVSTPLTCKMEEVSFPSSQILMASTFSTDMTVKEELSFPSSHTYGQGSQILYFQYFIAIFHNGCPPTCQIENIPHHSNLLDVSACNICILSNQKIKKLKMAAVFNGHSFLTRISLAC